MFDSYGVQLYYEIHGHGPRVLVFMHGILMDSKMNRRLATDLAALGHRVVLLDLPGHGLSEKPRRASYHRIDTYARHVVALLDHLGIDQAVIGGVSLGGNVSLMVGAQNPQPGQGPRHRDAGPRVGAAGGCPHLHSPALGRAFRPTHPRADQRRSSGGCPAPGTDRSTAWWTAFPTDPRETAAVLHGILAGPIAPTVGQRASMDIPALVIGHQVDRIHPFHDAEQLSRRLPRAELLEAESIFELRMHPERLTSDIDAFLDRVWSEPKTAARPAEPAAPAPT